MRERAARESDRVPTGDGDESRVISMRLGVLPANAGQFFTFGNSTPFGLRNGVGTLTGLSALQGLASLSGGGIGARAGAVTA